MLRVSPDGRHLVSSDGTPFFWLADTAWELFNRLRRDDVSHYLTTRAGQGFNVVQAVLLAECDGLTTPNAEGNLPLIEGDPAKPNEAYFQLVDLAVRQANALGIVMALLPTWGHWVGPRLWAAGGEGTLNARNAAAYGRFLGRRYREADVVWVIGGDRNPAGYEGVWRELVRGIKEGEAGREHLMTYHPQGGSGSAEFFHDEPWLDFNMRQTGHFYGWAGGHEKMPPDYARTPAKPCLNAEPLYEDIARFFQPANGRFNDHDVRAVAYRSVFAGACGHTYGASGVWQMLEDGRKPLCSGGTPWRPALHLPGATHMRHLRRLVESRPMLTRRPLPLEQVIEPRGGQAGDAADAVVACGDGKTYAMVYFPFQWPSVTIKLPRLGGRRVWWFDPRTGKATEADLGRAAVVKTSAAIGMPLGPDAVLVLDAPSAGYAPPGA
ncbi:MAG: DUF4038 domain-containing protein [Phycisphaerae bacterium]